MKIGEIGKDVVEKAGPRLKWKQRVGADADNKQGRVKGRGERRKEERNSLEGKKNGGVIAGETEEEREMEESSEKGSWLRWWKAKSRSKRSRL